MIISHYRPLGWLLTVILLIGTLSVFPPVPTHANEMSAISITDAQTLLTELESQDSTLPLILEKDILLTTDVFCDVWCEIVGTHTLDLNGYSFCVINTANQKGDNNAWDSVLFSLTDGASLTVIDSSESKTGAIRYSASIDELPDFSHSASLSRLTGRHLFLVGNQASLTILDGHFSAGEVQKRWVHRGITYKNEQFEFFTGFSDHVVYGTVITVANGGTLSISGGNFSAHGANRTNADPYNKGWEEIQPASACVRALSGSKVTIYNGRYEGNAGADVFAFEAEASVSVRSGEFVNTPVVSERLTDMEEFAFLAGTAVSGDIMLPLSCIPSLSLVNISHGDTILTELTRNETLRDSEGIAYRIQPKEGYKTAIASPDLRSGIYTLGNKGTLSASYTPYYATGSDISCEWYFTNANGTVVSIPTLHGLSIDLSTVTTLEGCSLNRGEKYVFRCIITETNSADPTIALTTVSETYTVSVSNFKTVAAVSLSPSAIDNNNQYYAGQQAPSFSPVSKSNFSIKSTAWYRNDQTTSLGAKPILQPCAHYIVVFTLTASNGYIFSDQTRVTYIPGGTNASIVSSADGSSATVTVHFTTGCSHSTTTVVVTSEYHLTVCTHCGTLLDQEIHTFGAWQNDVAITTTNNLEEEGEATDSNDIDNGNTGDGDSGGSDSDDGDSGGSDSDDGDSGDGDSGDGDSGDGDSGDGDSGDGDSDEDEDQNNNDTPVAPIGTMSHICTQCLYTETVTILPDLDDKNRIASLTITFEAPFVGEAPTAPILYDTMHNASVSLEGYEWKNAEGEDLTAFSADGNNLLTVVLKIKNGENDIFDSNSQIRCPFGTVTESEISDNGATMTLTFAIETCSRPSISGSLPAVSAGASILNAMPNFAVLSPLTVVWYQDGKIIGSYTMSDKNRSDVVDSNPDDGVDFLSATFADGHVYHCCVLWDFTESGVYVDKKMISLSGNAPAQTTVKEGFSGFYSVAYALIPSDHIIRSSNVTGIDSPAAGNTPDTSATVPSGAPYKIKSVVWNTSSFACGGSYTVTVTLTPNSGYRFHITDQKNHGINGVAASATMNGTNLVLSYTFATTTHSFDVRSAERLLPTCDTEGSVIAVCKHCSTTSVYTIPARGHRVSFFPTSPATCTDDGLKEHYRCVDCLQLFSDETASTPTTKEALVLIKDPSAHRFHEELFHDGNHHYQLCLDCYEARRNESTHTYGQWLTNADGLSYHVCDCGHEIGQDGPRQPTFRVNGDENLDPSGESDDNDSQDSSSSASSLMKKIKIFLLLIALLLLAILIAIIVLIVLLLMNRRSQKALETLETNSEAVDITELTEIPEISETTDERKLISEEAETEIDSNLTIK